MVWVVLAIIVLAGAMDLHDLHRRRRRRSAGDMLRRRHDELADVWSTQHSGGYSFPGYDLHKHRDALERP